MRVLFVSARADFGGGPEHLYQLLLRLPEGVEAFVACPDDAPYADKYRELLGQDHLFILPHRAFRLDALRGLRRCVRQQGIGVLHSHGRGGGLYARLLSLMTKIPCVHTFHGFFPPPSGGKRLLYLAFERLAAHFSAKLICVGHAELALVKALGLQAKHKTVLIQNGVHIPSTPCAFPEGSPKRVLVVARLVDQKNPLFWPQVLAQLALQGRGDDFVLQVAGDGELRAKLEAEAARLGVGGRMEMLGFVPEGAGLLDGAFCLLSAARFEGLPLSVLEAMAAGLPPVLSDVRGHSELIEHGHAGLLFAHDDAAMAAAQLISLADDPDLWARLSKQARQEVRTTYNAELMAGQTFALLAEVAGRKQK